MEYFMTNVLPQIFELCIVPLLGILTSFLILFIKTKMAEVSEKIKDDTARKYLNMLTDTVVDCVMATNQTYVDALKKEGKFGAEAQKVALQTTYDEVMKLLNAEAKEYLTEASGDLEALIKTKIEATVKAVK